MNLTGFTEKQKETLLDLLVMGMYADSHLAHAEEARIQKLLDGLQPSSPHMKNQFVDASVARVRKFGTSPESVAGTLADMAREFATLDTRRKAADALEALLSSDDTVIDREREFLAKVRNAFGC